jgi:Tripartite tricarboxylate transporter TctB family
MRKFLEGRVLFCFFLAAVGASVVGYAHDWPLKAALFPMMTGIPLLVLALIQLVLELRGRMEPSGHPVMDLQHSTDVPAELARRRTFATFAWMAGFILLVLFVGFSLAVPIFAFSYLKFQGSAGFRTSVPIAAAAWAFFYGLFERVLQLQFEAGLIQTWLGL